MSTLFVRLLDRQTFAPALASTLGFRVVRYSHHNWGGPLDAEIEVTGNEADLWQLQQRMRYGVEIYDEQGETVWWGYLHELKLHLGAYQIGYSMDRMTNRIAVAYEALEPGANGTGKRATTSWAQNDESVATYGTKDDLLSLSNASAAQANALRDNALAVLAEPLPDVGLGDDSPATATLLCKGWYFTLDWRQYNAAAVGVVYTTVLEQDNRTWTATYISGVETADFAIGISSTTTQYAQSFPIGSTEVMTLTKLKLKLVRVGTPGDVLMVDICTDVSGSPGTVIATASVNNSQVSTTTNQVVDIAFSVPPVLLPGTYWVRARRSGGVDAVNFFRALVVASGGYGSGSAKRWSGSAWVAETADILFEVTTEAAETALDVGAVSARQRIAQGFRVVGSTAHQVGTVKLKLATAQTPTDNLFVDVCADDGTIVAPGAVLATSAAVAASTLTAALDWVTFTFATPATVQPSTQYWLALRRSGSVSDINFFKVASNTAQGYADGIALAYNGSGWSSTTPNVDVLFEVGGVQETTEQLRAVLGAAGQFFTGIEIEQASGVYGSPYRDGDASALHCIEELLEVGTSGGTRLRLDVTRERVARVFAEEVLGSNDLYLKRDGTLEDRLGGPLPNARSCVGRWARLKDLDAAVGVSAGQGGAFSIYFEEAEYSADRELVRRKGRETRNPLDLLKPQ